MRLTAVYIYYILSIASNNTNISNILGQNKYVEKFPISEKIKQNIEIKNNENLNLISFVK